MCWVWLSAGKTQAFIYKAIDLAFRNINYQGVLLEPTNSLVKIILQPKFEQTLFELGIPYDVKQVPVPTYVLHFEQGDCTIMMMSGENFERHIGYEVAFVGVDEIDTIPQHVCTKMIQKLQGRIRIGNVNQLFVVSTPESFSWMYNFFVKEDSDDKRLIKAKTSDNPFLPKDYIPKLMAAYPANLIEAYLNGNFVNLTGGNVYSNFDRHIHDTNVDEHTYRNSIINIGVDFNIGNTTGIAFVINEGLPYAVGEITKQHDTRALIDTIKRRYPNRPIVVYPDASGDSRKTAATNTDIALLKQAGFNVKVSTKNPPVRDRVNSVQALLRDGNGKVRLRVNSKNCPTLVECFEKQAYDTKGDPDKHNGFDHPLDCVGYFVWWHWPLYQRKGIQIINAA